MLLIKMESEQLVAGESVFTMGTLDLVQPSVLNFKVPGQVVLAQALLRAQAAVVDGLNLERVVGGEVKLETVIVLQLGDRLVAIWEGALVEGGRHHVLVIKVTQPQGLLAVQKDPENSLG